LIGLKREEKKVKKIGRKVMLRERKWKVSIKFLGVIMDDRINYI